MSSSVLAPALGTHLDENEQPCTQHQAAAPEVILGLATVGSRASGFNHDIASKLQGLMMALDEIGELADSVADPSAREQLVTAADGAQASLKEILAVLNTNRAMTKPAMRAPVPLSELTTRAGERVYVTLRGAVPDLDVSVSAPTCIHALSLVFDIASGPGRGRTLPVDIERSSTHISLGFTIIVPTPPNCPEALTLATYVLTRDGGGLRCTDGGSRIVVSLPIA